MSNGGVRVRVLDVRIQGILTILCFQASKLRGVSRPGKAKKTQSLEYLKGMCRFSISRDPREYSRVRVLDVRVRVLDVRVRVLDVRVLTRVSRNRKTTQSLEYLKGMCQMGGECVKWGGNVSNAAILIWLRLFSGDWVLVGE